MAKNTLGSANLGGKKGPFMFPRPNMNFTTGRFKPPSKNVGQQNLFQQNNPYAEKLNTTIGQYGQGSSLSDIVGLAGRAAQAQYAQSPTSGVAQPPMNLAGLQSFAGANTNQLDAINQIAHGTPMERLAGQQINMNENKYITDAARLAGGAMAGNPYITPEAKLQMARGYAPALNQINPAFWQYTSPVIQQALQGLLQSTGVRPEEQDFFREIGTPLGLN